MMNGIIRRIFIRAAGFLLTLTIGLGLAFVQYIYVHRQAVFVEAAHRGNFRVMKVVYALGVDVNAAACKHRTCFNAMWGAAYGGHDDTLRFLIEHGAGANAKPAEFPTTALMIAAYAGHKRTVQLLLSQGADVNANIDGRTALSLARSKGHTEIVELLRQAGARDTP